MLKLTLDTNILRDMIDDRRQGYFEAMELLGLYESGKCDIRVTSRLDTDIPKEPLRTQISTLPLLDKKRLSTPLRLDYSCLDGPDMLDGPGVVGEESFATLEAKLMKLLFPGSDCNSNTQRNRVADIDHLIGHKIGGRDIFLTCDKGILEQSKALLEEVGIKVLSPGQYLKEINS